VFLQDGVQDYVKVMAILEIYSYDKEGTVFPCHNGRSFFQSWRISVSGSRFSNSSMCVWKWLRLRSQIPAFLASIMEQNLFPVFQFSV